MVLMCLSCCTDTFVLGRVMQVALWSYAFSAHPVFHSPIYTQEIGAMAPWETMTTALLETVKHSIFVVCNEDFSDPSANELAVLQLGGKGGGGHSFASLGLGFELKCLRREVVGAHPLAFRGGTVFPPGRCDMQLYSLKGCSEH